MTTGTATIPRRSIGYLLGMTSLMFGANFVWVSYNSILLLPLVQRVVAPEYSSLTVGVIAFFSTFVGITVSILTGIISDHSTSRWGRRGPAILIGALVGLPFIACAGIFHLSLPTIAVSYLGMQFFTNVANGAWWPLLVDTVPENQRGLASGLQGFLTLVAAAVGFVVVTYLNEIDQAGTALIVMGAVFAATGIVNALTIRPYDKPAEGVQRISLWKAFRGMFSVRTRVAVFFWLVFSAFLVNMGLNSLQYFARDFLRIYLGLANPDAGLRIFGLVSLVLTMLAAVGTGLLSDRFGRRRLILLGALGSALTTVLMALTRDFILFLVLVGVRSIATGPVVAVIPAMASDLSPKDEAGQYMAYGNLSTGVSGAVSSLLFGAILNMRGAATAESFTLLLLVAAVFYMLGGIVFQMRVPQRELDERIRAGAIA
jgi:MFS family permease